MKRSLSVISEIERKNSKKLGKTYKTFKDVVHRLRDNVETFEVNEMDHDVFGRAYQYKNVMMQVVKDYISFSK